MLELLQADRQRGDPKDLLRRVLSRRAVARHRGSGGDRAHRLADAGTVLILAADTSLPLLSVALLRDDDLLASAALEGKGSRNEKLLPAIDWLLGEAGVGRREVDLF